jgi:hypothetical protein
MRRSHFAALLVLLGLVLLMATGCVGGGSTSTPTPTPVNHATPVASDATLAIPVSPEKVVSKTCLTPTLVLRKAKSGQGRETTGVCTAKSFARGEGAIGGLISFRIGHRVISFTNCFIASAPMEGFVSNGVVNPWPDEVTTSGFPPCPTGFITAI